MQCSRTASSSEKAYSIYVERFARSPRVTQFRSQVGSLANASVLMSVIPDIPVILCTMSMSHAWETMIPPTSFSR